MFTKTSRLKTPASHMSLHTVKSFFMMLFKCWHLIYMHAWCFHISLITDSADDLTAETSLSCRYQSNTVLKISSAETADMWDGLLSHSPTLPGFHGRLPGVAILLNFSRLMESFHTLFITTTVPGAEQRLVYCSVSTHPPRRARDGQRIEKRKKYLKARALSLYQRG